MGFPGMWMLGRFFPKPLPWLIHVTSFSCWCVFCSWLIVKFFITLSYPLFLVSFSRERSFAWFSSFLQIDFFLYVEIWNLELYSSLDEGHDIFIFLFFNETLSWRDPFQTLCLVWYGSLYLYNNCPMIDLSVCLYIYWSRNVIWILGGIARCLRSQKATNSREKSGNKLPVSWKSNA